MDDIVVTASGMPNWIQTLVFGLALAALVILAQRPWGRRHDLYVFRRARGLTWSSPIVFRVGDEPWLSMIPISLGLVALLAVPMIDRWLYQLALHGAMATFSSGLSQLLVWLVVDELYAPEALSIATEIAAPLLCAGLAMSMMRLRPRLYRGIQAMLQPGQPALPVAPPTLTEPAPRQAAPSPDVGRTSSSPISARSANAFSPLRKRCATFSSRSG